MYRQGYLVESDKTVNQQFMIANGDVIEGATIIIRELKIGDIVFENVDASIDAVLARINEELSKE